MPLCECGCGQEALNRFVNGHNTPIAPRPPYERTMEKVVFSEDSDCWIFVGGKSQNGYGVMGVGSMKDGTRRKKPAHQVTWEYWNGAMPEGEELDHLCCTPACVNPDHLESVTHWVNMHRYRVRAGFE